MPSPGNSAKSFYTQETWTSPELQTVVLSKANNPGDYTFTQQLVDIQRSEPDPSLFQPPPGYTIVNEKGEFEITWSRLR